MSDLTDQPVWKLVWLLWIVMAITLVSGMIFQAWESVFISGLALVLSLLPVILPRTWKIHVPRSFLVAIVIFTFCTIYLGEFIDFYDRFWWWDVVLHFGSAFGIGLLGVTLMLVLHKRDRVRARPFLLSLFAFSFAVAVGVIWEVFEFAMDNLLGTNMQRSGLVDTMWDLIVDCLGAALASVVGYLYLRKKRRHGRLEGLEAAIDEAVERNCPDGAVAS